MDKYDSDSDAPAIEQALFVEENSDEEINLNVPPTSGNEYLRRVRQEAMGCPQVVVADLDTSAFNHKQTVKVTEPGGLLPVPPSYRAPMSWQRLQVAEFAALRQKLIQYRALIKQKKVNIPTPNLPHANNADSWCKFCFGKIQGKSEKLAGDSVAGSVDSDQGTPPLLQIVAFMNQFQVTKVLEYHINWMEATGFSSQQGRWFFALLASLQKPLTPEMCSWIRRLARLCSNIRATLESPEDPLLKELNLIICLVSRYFGQRDLADS
ncbi:gem-associated protein 2-like [Biomphalaria glabrata]|uniref:Gem-associated protein 2 n=1 Tax=Biomphalaria glabrata TaxID=6526 RepID=A0A9U8E4C9_BIOGL|nr:gem-associated protein 2-like [Biomphalaria glabrata]KAI8745454.1 gem-associated protein 2 [Biomphalaria glabrata]